MNKGKKYKCCLCKEHKVGYGNIPAPVKKRGLCCDECNIKTVMPARMIAIYGRTENLT